MKNKKGFTLVELLAVIAILAILVIIALPNIIKTYNDAKEASFINEAKNIYKTALQQWLLDSMTNGDAEIFYARCDGCQSTQLSLSGRENIDYFIEFNTSGEVLNFYVTDGTFQTAFVSLFGSKLDINELDYLDRISELEDVDIINILEVEEEAYERYESGSETDLGCEPGKYLVEDSGTSKCMPCPANTYKTVSGNQACTPCGVNFCSDEGATMCTFCGSIKPITPITPPSHELY